MKKLQYCWVVCAVCALAVVCTLGLNGNVFSVFFPFLDAQGYSSTVTSSLLTVRCVFTLLAMILTTYYYRILSLKWGLTVALCLCAAGYVIFSVSHGLLALYIASTACGLSYGFGSMIPVSILMRNWFSEKQALAISICAAGSGISTIFFPALINLLVNRIGLANTYQVNALFAIVCAAMVLLCIADRPEQRGMRPYGAAAEQVRHDAGVSNTTVENPMFGYVIAIMFLLGAVTTTAIGHLSILFTTSGFGIALASSSVSVFGITLTLGKFVFGWMCDRFGGKVTSVTSFIILTTGCFLCAACAGKSDWFAYLAAIVLGLGYPVASIGSSIWAADFSDEGRYARDLKWYQVTYQIGGMICSSLPGFLYGAAGTYTGAFLILALFSITACLLLVLIYRIRSVKEES